MIKGFLGDSQAERCEHEGIVNGAMLPDALKLHHPVPDLTLKTGLCSTRHHIYQLEAIEKYLPEHCLNTLAFVPEKSL